MLIPSNPIPPSNGAGPSRLQLTVQELLMLVGSIVGLSLAVALVIYLMACGVDPQLLLDAIKEVVLAYLER